MLIKAAVPSAMITDLQSAGRGKMGKSLNEIGNIYKEIADEEKKLNEDFASISLETIEIEYDSA